MSIKTFPQTSLGAAAVAVVEKIEPKREPFAPGIYFNLEEDSYHADEAFGSTDIRRLARDPRSAWWESRFNQMRDDEDDDEKGAAKEAKVIGKATHAAVLEGREALEERFAPTFHKGNVKAGKDERAAIIASGKEPIKFKRWKRIQLAASIIRNDPEVGEAFTNTIATELSVFWVCSRSGMRKKARFDAVKPRSIVDFKTITNRDDIPFEELCKRHIGRYGYYTQAECYKDAWEQIPGMIDSGLVFNSPSNEAVSRLARASSQKLTAFVFVFLQKEGAPLVWGTTISPGNGIIDHARADIETAEANWIEYIQRFGGTDTPWITSKPLEELDMNEIPSWSFRRY